MDVILKRLISESRDEALPSADGTETQDRMAMTTQTNYERRSGLQVSSNLDDFVTADILLPLGIERDAFWTSFANIVTTFGPRNADLLARRTMLQEQLDDWHLNHSGKSDVDAYRTFLFDIGYLEPLVEPFKIDVGFVDREISTIAGPQLVVPLDNARYALNAANARWNSLFDALYGSNVIDEGDDATRDDHYNPVRGTKVIAYVNGFLDDVVPLSSGSYRDIVQFEVTLDSPAAVAVILRDGKSSRLSDPEHFVGYERLADSIRILLRNHGLHIELVVDRQNPVGQQNPSGISDVILESALTTIQDCEDSVAAVDAEDKIHVYRNWLGLMTGELEATFEKDGARVNRQLQLDRSFTAPNGAPLTLPGRSLLLIRTVGLHMMTDTVLTEDGRPIPEGLLDTWIAATIALHDLKSTGSIRNSVTGSVYIVKPKIHGSEEVAFTVDVFAAVERHLGLPENTIKLGIMDEERRTSLNLAACIGAARNRVIFVNTGFLDRTGDEIHSDMLAGPLVRKGDMRSTKWQQAYERLNVKIALATGFHGAAQIGKGMWAMPDEMSEMVATKVAHPLAGASCAWVPSPTAATLHAMHYHLVDVSARQDAIAEQSWPSIDDLLQLPVLERFLYEDEIREELLTNAQSILGYVVRWINQGIGCSKVPNIDGVALMEDRATLRISSQHIANWLHYGLLDREMIESAFLEMSALVDKQNANDPDYRPFLPNAMSNPGYSAALELIFECESSENGYTEAVLHKWRRRVKAMSRDTSHQGAST